MDLDRACIYNKAKDRKWISIDIVYLSSSFAKLVCIFYLVSYGTKLHHLDGNYNNNLHQFTCNKIYHDSIFFNENIYLVRFNFCQISSYFRDFHILKLNPISMYDNKNRAYSLNKMIFFTLVFHLLMIKNRDYNDCWPVLLFLLIKKIFSTLVFRLLMLK